MTINNLSILAERQNIPDVIDNHALQNHILHFITLTRSGIYFFKQFYACGDIQLNGIAKITRILSNEDDYIALWFLALKLRFSFLYALFVAKDKLIIIPFETQCKQQQ